MSNPLETPPPITVTYAEEHDRFGAFEVDPGACAAVLRGFDVDDEHIASTTMNATGNSHTERIPYSDSIVVPHPIYSTSKSILPDGSGTIDVNVGSIKSNPEEGVTESALLIPGLSQRADLVKMGWEGLEAEKAAAMRKLRNRTAIRPVIQSSVAAVGCIGAEVFAEQQGVISTPVALAVGAVTVALAGLWAKNGAAGSYRREVKQYNALKKWPADLRAAQREEAYAADSSAPRLVIS